MMRETERESFGWHWCAGAAAAAAGGGGVPMLLLLVCWCWCCGCWWWWRAPLPLLLMLLLVLLRLLVVATETAPPAGAPAGVARGLWIEIRERGRAIENNGRFAFRPPLPPQHHHLHASLRLHSLKPSIRTQPQDPNRCGAPVAVAGGTTPNSEKARS